MREFRILGPLEVADGEEVLPLTGQKQRALLALLLLEANRVVSTDRLVDALWGDQPPRTAATSLQNFVSQLRKLLGSETLVTKPPGYLLRMDPEELDLERFRRLVDEARSEPPDARAARQRRCRSTTTPAACSSRSSESTRARRCNTCTVRSCARTRASTPAQPPARLTKTDSQTSPRRCSPVDSCLYSAPTWRS